ncbi:MAG: hypothetical protein HYR85_24780 [Planctomycetes bacterium]|nr:hypothetical protein [Planctomycetota bacterium]
MQRPLSLRVLHFAASLVASIGSAAVARADVKLPAIVGDNMVLQRESDVALWGFADPGEAVRVKGDWMASDASAVAAADGLWLVRVRTPEAGGPHTITFAGKNTITLQNVLVGEVWICSGQSNMEWSVGPHVGPGIANFEEEVRNASFPKIRLFDVQNAIAAAPARDCVGSWVECSPQTVVPFSAVGYFFGRMLHRELGVPIGLVASNWGGTLAEAWTSARTLREFPEFADALAHVARVREHAADLRAEIEHQARAWWTHVDESDPGSRGAAFAKPDLDDSDWKTMDLPGAWDDKLANFDGVVWYRRTVDVPADWAGADLVLDLGPIDDVDDAWVGGVRVGGLHGEGDHATPREYAVPASAVHAGRNVIAIRAIDTGGAGGLTGKPDDLRLRRATSDGSAIPLAGSWRYRAGASMAQLGPRPRQESMGPNTPTALYNGMIAPLVPFGIRGAIWYQGEANVSEAHLYRRLFPAMIADWRASFGRGDFPFYFVQIAPFAYDDDRGEAAELREAQAMATSVANTGMAVTLDIGNPTNIHPSNKQEVGRRLALPALANTYGRKGLVTSGPTYKSMSVEGSAIRLRFDHADGGLRARAGKPLGPFTIAGADRRFVPATARLDGETIVVSSPDVAAPAAVRYAWGAADEGTLENGAGLPSSSFRTDDWPSITEHPAPPK